MSKSLGRSDAVEAEKFQFSATTGYKNKPVQVFVIVVVVVVASWGLIPEGFLP